MNDKETIERIKIAYEVFVQGKTWLPCGVEE